jgi:hypothetical protein
MTIGLNNEEGLLDNDYFQNFDNEVLNKFERILKVEKNNKYIINSIDW